MQKTYEKLTRKRLGELPKVRSFLESVGRNSKKTQYAYHASMVDFQGFLDEKYPGQTANSILQDLSQNQINVYELLEGFVSFEISKKLSGGGCVNTAALLAGTQWAKEVVVENHD
jgi:hypothetical protein